MPKYKVVPVEPTDQWVSGLRCGYLMSSPKDLIREVLTAAPDTGTVAVPRELLERCVNRWACCAMAEAPGAETAWNELRKFLEGV